MAQKWKRREFIAAQIKEFESDRRIQLAMAMLDWNDRVLSFPSEDGKDSQRVRVSDDLLCSALLPHEAANGYYPNEVLIRDCLDRFMDMLVRLENFVDADLISINELRPYITYWVHLMSGQMPGWHSPDVFVLFLNYIQRYGFAGAARLIKKFGYESTAPLPAVEKAIARALLKRAQGEWTVGVDLVIDPPSG